MSEKPSLILLPGGNANGTGIPDKPANWDAVLSMLNAPGFYIAGDPGNPGASTPIISLDGEIYTLDIGRKLDPVRLPPTATFAGPFTAGTKVVRTTAPAAGNDDG